MSFDGVNKSKKSVSQHPPTRKRPHPHKPQGTHSHTPQGIHRKKAWFFTTLAALVVIVIAVVQIATEWNNILNEPREPVPEDSLDISEIKKQFNDAFKKSSESFAKLSTSTPTSTIETNTPTASTTPTTTEAFIDIFTQQLKHNTPNDSN